MNLHLPPRSVATYQHFVGLIPVSQNLAPIQQAQIISNPERSCLYR